MQDPHLEGQTEFLNAHSCLGSVEIRWEFGAFEFTDVHWTEENRQVYISTVLPV